MSAAAMPWLTGRRALVVGDGEAVAAVADAIAAAGGSVRRAPADLVDLPAIEQVFDEGEVDLLVHAGTRLPSDPPEAISLDEWRASFSADIDGRFLFSAAFARRIIGDPERHGAILLLMPPFRVDAGRAAAGTAHGALDNLVKSLAVEWARDGIRINAIASRSVPDFAERGAEEQAGLCHLSTWLLSDYAAYMTGTVAGIDEL